jgi:predicted ribosome quality control (RQC) complex YloA/Tae2 family protein
LEQIELREPTVSKEAQTPSGFREFTVFGGMKVLVGRNAKQNDELTTHVAKKEDLWLHARGVPGSHVVLQSGGRKQIPKEAIEQAAELAAFYSEAKTQSLAPVSYTLKKYVRKPKGAGPGAVVMEREEVIMVEPRSGERMRDEG